MGEARVMQELKLDKLTGTERGQSGCNNPSPFYRALREQERSITDAKTDVWFGRATEDAMAVLRGRRRRHARSNWLSGPLGHGFVTNLPRSWSASGASSAISLACDPPRHTRLRG